MRISGSQLPLRHAHGSNMHRVGHLSSAVKLGHWLGLPEVIVALWLVPLGCCTVEVQAELVQCCREVAFALQPAPSSASDRWYSSWLLRDFAGSQRPHLGWSSCCAGAIAGALQANQTLNISSDHFGRGDQPRPTVPRVTSAVCEGSALDVAS